MTKRPIFLILFFFTFIFLSSLTQGFNYCLAGELTLLEPKRCERTGERPNIYNFDFASAEEQEGVVRGTLLIQNGSPGWKYQVTSATIWVNGEKVVGPDSFGQRTDVLQIPLENLKKKNHLKVKINGIPGTYITVRISEIGSPGPKFSGPRQYPFVCRTEQSDLGQPLIDNYKGDGIPVYLEDDTGAKTDTIAGYCKDCSTVTRVDYYYGSTDGKFKPIEKFSGYPTDLAYTTTNEGTVVPYIVRLERGTINRFIYGIAMLRPWNEEGKPMDAWNGKLFFKFDGGVAIGHDQGRLSTGNTLYDEALRRGYAVAYSTGNRTGVHYNLELAGETAIMVKEHFIDRFGEPEYTMSIGGSGGAIQQYAFAQNHPGLIDGIIPQRSYSDMITQTIYVGDCMLMEFYFDVLAPIMGDTTFGGFSVNPSTGEITHLGTPENRTWLEGLSTSDTEPHPIYTPMTGKTGSTECVNGWIGLTPLVMNPLFTDVDGLDQFPEQEVMDVKWTHWDDLKNIYGVDENGYAPSTWDNVGVQYGLQALLDGNISMEKFIGINARIGGWKKPEQMKPEGYPFSLWNEVQHLIGPEPDPSDFDPWSIRNSTFSNSGISPRTAGDIEAMNAAYTSGHVFIGKLDVPVLDIRDYLDPVLDMHHAQQSFATRKRIIDYKGNADGHLIWMKDRNSGFDITGAAIDLMHQWLTNIVNNPEGGMSGNRPQAAEDKCFCEDGTVYEGPDVWDGILNDNPNGDCTETFHMYSTSRIIAGGDIGGDVFKCYLIPVEEAVERGFYGEAEIEEETLMQLKLVFPDGVCDYSLGDAGRPETIR